MLRIYLFIVLSFGLSVGGMFWFFTDPRPMKIRVEFYLTKRLISGLMILVIVIFQFINLVSYPWLKLPGGTMVTIIGLLIYFLGSSLAVWAKLAMRSFWGPPGQHAIERQNKLITSGPFAYTRNPIYLSILLVSISYFLALQSYFVIFITIPLIQILEAVREEEILLEKYFGKRYLKYKEKTPRFI